MLLSDQIRVIEQAKFTYFPLGKTFKKQVKAIEDQGAKKIKATENRVKKQILDAYQKSVTRNMVEKYHISCLKKDLFRLKTFQNLFKIL